MHSTKQKASRSSHHLRMKTNNRVDDLQGMEQMQQMLREWKAELREASPANSLLQSANPSSSELSSDMERLLQFSLKDEDDDATSKAAPMTSELEQQSYNRHPPSPAPYQEAVGLEAFARIEQILQENPQSNLEAGAKKLTAHSMSDYSSRPIIPPSAAFLYPKCALWDCPRPAVGPNGRAHYCSHFHEDLAIKEGAPGMPPVKLLFTWVQNLFDVAVHPGETLREWLFFDKPRRAFESGRRKQRSLPDYEGRGWHESRKQRSYYMDPQPEGRNEWHLYEYELASCTDCALYRLELKQGIASKKGGKARVQSQTQSDTSVASLQHQIGRLTADLSQFEGQKMLSSDLGRGELVPALANQSSSQRTPFNCTAELQ
uniref:Uncharacterized protein n=1 Tax=Physcomitrium patens TaxID=3218 RepID=A0A7I4F7B2_PHYPA